MAAKHPKPKKFQSWTETHSFPDRVTWAREERGKTQSQLAALVGCSQQNIGKAERAGAEGSSYTVQIAAQLSVNALWLATGEGEPELNLKDLTIDAINLAMAVSYLPSDTKSPLVRRLLATALPFIPASHPRYRVIEEIYLNAMDKAAEEPKTDASGKRPPIKPPLELVTADAQPPRRKAAKRVEKRAAKK